MSDDRPVAYWESDVAVFRASGLGTCEKALTALLLDYSPVPTPKYLEAAFAFGHEHEQEVIDAFLEQHPHFEVVTQQQEIEYWVTKNIMVRGHTDGVVRHTETGESFVLEVKTLGKDLFRAFTRGQLYTKLPSYGFQKTLYALATELPVLYVVLDKAAYLASNGKDVVLVTETYRDVDMSGIDELFAKLIRSVGYAKKGQLPDGVCNGSLCPVPYLHDEEDAEPIVQGDDSLSALAARYRVLKAEEDRVKAELSVIRSKIREGMDGNDKVQAGSYRLTVVRQSRTSPDREALEADGLWDKYTKTSDFEYVRVSEVAEEK